MSSQRDAQVKKPVPRRLFSAELLKSSESSGNTRNVERRVMLDESQPETVLYTTSEGRERFASSIGLDKHPPSTNDSRTRTLPFLPIASLRPNSPSLETLPPSQARWEHIRQHVLAPLRPATPPTPLPQPSPQPSSAPSSIVSFPRPPSRAQTPKPSRLAAKFGFRQVVDHAREVAIDENRSFSEEVLRACWATRLIESQAKAKYERDMMGPGAPSKHLPFKSTVSLGSTGTSSTSNVSTKKSEPRHSGIGFGSSHNVNPSVRYLHSVLCQASGASTTALRSAHLPHENLVLSALLKPFASGEISAQVEEERYLAVDAYELIVKMWPPANELSTAERCLWCTKAALPPSSLRGRILSSLRGLTLPNENNHIFLSLDTIQSLAKGLFPLLPLFSSREEGQDYLQILKEIISYISVGPVDEDALEEEYSASWSRNDSADDIRQLVISEAFALCIEVCPRDARIWLLQRAFEEYWHPAPNPTSLKQSICSRRVIYFTNAAFSLITSDDIQPDFRLMVISRVVQLLDTFVLPEAEAISGKRSMETKSFVARLILEILCHGDLHSSSSRWAASILVRWYASGAGGEWRVCFEEMLERIVTTAEWPVIVATLSGATSRTPESVRNPLIAFTFPYLTERLVEDPPVVATTSPLSSSSGSTTTTNNGSHLLTLLQTISQLYPQVFFKPLFACAASTRTVVVANQLCIVCILARLVKDWWVRDAEMVGVALMSDMGPQQSSESESGGGKEWANVKLGQRIVLLELIGKLRGLRRVRDSGIAGGQGSNAERVNLLKFVAGLEVRLAVLIDAREKVTPIPPSQRLLFCILFREIRLLTRSLKPAPWLPSVLTWFEDYFRDQELEKKYEDEIELQISGVQNLYVLAKDNANSSYKRRTFAMMPSASTTIPASGGDVQVEQLQVTDILGETLRLVNSLGKGFVPRVMKLLVTVSSLLSPADYQRIGPIVWYQGLGKEWEGVMPLVCFLVMQCAEKTALDFRGMVEVDMHSSHDLTRLEAIQKISTIVSWRFQLMSHYILSDRNHRPFKLARAPLPFVPTDMGSANYLHNENSSTKAKDVVPLELRKQLVEIGWGDNEAPVNHKEEWVKTPVSLMAINQVERLDQQRTDQKGSAPRSPSPVPSSAPLSSTSSNKAEEGELLRRISSSGGPTHAKRRAVFVPALSLVFLVLAPMVYDPNHDVASAARDTLVDLMRNDPAILLRPILDLLCGDGKDFFRAVNILNTVLNTQNFLPPSMTHAMFNNLAGFLKFTARQVDFSGSLHQFALLSPIMANLSRHVGNLTMLGIRRSKMEHFLIPYGTLWFKHAGTPSGPMFPRGTGVGAKSVNPFEPLNPKLVSVVMIRTAQNMMFVDMLKKNAQDVVVVRKTMPRFVVPTLDGVGDEEGVRTLQLCDFVPFKKAQTTVNGGDEEAAATLRALSLVLARSYVTLVAQVFRCMSRNSNDRAEMLNSMDGLNRILLAHGDDIGIVGHVLIAYMVASARFRRLFISGGGYSLFIPALVKVYAESSQRLDIKLAIEYAVFRFYVMHREAFLFQSLEAITNVAALPGTDTTEYATKVYDLFYSLRNGVAPASLDPAGIHDINQSQEKEALLFSVAEDKPQTFLSAIRRGDDQNNRQIVFDVPESNEGSRLRMEDFVKLFLTIIAHDPTILRSQNFIRMLRYLTPHLYHASSQARNVLQEGLSALGNILLKAFSRSKVVDLNPAARIVGGDAAVLNMGSGIDGADKSKITSNQNVMRLDFLFSLIAVAQAGCPISTVVQPRLAIETAKLILKESSAEMLEPISTIFADLTKLIVLRIELSKPKLVISFLHDMSAIIRTYIATLDLAPVIQTIVQASSMPFYSNEPAFAQIVVHEICSAALEAFELVESVVELSKFRSRPPLVSLLAEAVFLRGADVIGELEKRKPSFCFLSKIVLPLTLTLKTADQLASESGRSEVWHRSSLSSSWIRLVFYAMTACQRSFRASGGFPLSRSKSREKRTKEEKRLQEHLPIFITALQIIKVIVVRAEAEISTTLPDLWHRLAAFLRSVLMDGNANFALVGSSDFSPLPSPTPSPRTSGQFDRSGNLPSFFDLPGHSTMDTSSTVPLVRPRFIDYALWSTLEFLCAYRSPLRLQLRLFTVEKVVALDQELKNIQRRTSPFASPVTRASRRISTSIFAKPRRSAVFPSPDSSPRVSRSPSTLQELSIPSIHPGLGSSGHEYGRLLSLEIPNSISGGELRSWGYANTTSPSLPTPATPKQGGVAYGQFGSQEQQGGPRIVHLGPLSPSSLNAPPLSPSGEGSMGISDIRLMAQSAKIKSVVLIKGTYRRIRTVQTLMGYDTLLPMPVFNLGMGIQGLGMEGDEVSFTTWTRRTALEAVLNEMKQLEEEFQEVLSGIAVRGPGEGESGYVENVSAATVGVAY